MSILDAKTSRKCARCAFLRANHRQRAVQSGDAPDLRPLPKQPALERSEHQTPGWLRQQLPASKSNIGKCGLNLRLPLTVARCAIERALELGVVIVQTQLERRNRGPNVRGARAHHRRAAKLPECLPQQRTCRRVAARQLQRPDLVNARALFDE